MRLPGFGLAVGILLATGACTPAAVQLPASAPAAPADSVSAVPVTGGVTYTRTLSAAGPWAIHALRIDRERCLPVLRAAKMGPDLSSRSTPSALGEAALAAVNADFFELPGGRPVGAHVSGGEVQIGPGARPVLAVTATGLVQGTARIEGWIATGTDTVNVHQVNRRVENGPPDAGALLLTRASGVEPAAGAIRVRRIAGTMRQGRGVVEEPGPATVLVNPDVLVIEGVPLLATGTAAGDTVEWEVALIVGGSDEVAVEAVGGFPTLLRDGRSVLSEQPGVRPDFGDRRHPRTAVGWNTRFVFLVVVDGRQPPWSDGMSLQELADLLLELGARDAINLDGGGSSTMVIRGRVVNRPSDAQGERAVGNALLLERCA